MSVDDDVSVMGGITIEKIDQTPRFKPVIYIIKT